MSASPTQPESPGNLEPAAAPARRRGVSFKVVALIGVGLFVVAGVIAFVAYQRLLHYERAAALHVPPGAAWAARLDVERVVLFEPVRKHLFPLIDSAASAEARGAQQPAQSARVLEALRREAGLNLGLDLREIVVAGLPDWQGWVLVLGGLFPDRTDLLVRISEVLFEQVGLPIRFEADSVLLLPGGHAFAQAGDGSLLLASSPELVRAARIPSQRHVELGLGKEAGVGGFALLARDMGAPAAGLGLLGLGSLEAVESVRGLLETEANGRLGVRVELATRGSAPQLAETLQSSIQSMQMMLGLVSAADWVEARALVSRAQVQATPENTVLLSSFWESAELDRACAALSRWLGAQMRAN